MRTRGLRHSGKLLALMLLATSLTGVGATYAGGSNTLNIHGKLTTAVFDMAAKASGEYRVSLVEPDGKTSVELGGVEAWTEEDGKSVEILFSEGIPADYLREGYALCLSVPLENGKGSFMNIRRYEPDFSNEWGQITLQAEEICLRLDGAVYLAEDGGSGLGNLLAAYNVPLKMAVYPSFEGEPDAMRGSLYLTLTEESLDVLAALPEKVEIPAETNGVLVRYRCEVPLVMDQSYEPDLIARAGEGGTA
ncbi:hypothetical protein [Oscillibacter sp.]|uniref:hypothetical protein n=1 Tax=Oscillibacter sp. TaxID=1945593 RepID=UPI00289C6F89|nr:hypothetical protein [Oscillibacter sp.]